MGHGSSQGSHAQLLYHILLCVLVSATLANKYVWKTGRWHECKHYQCGEGGTQIRSVFCGERDHNFKEVDPSECEHLQKPESMRSCFKVCAHHQNLLRWAEHEWSDCALSPEYRECSIKHGVKYRNVTCVWKNTGFPEDDGVCMEFMPKPETRSSCTLKCPQDCVVSSFSSWNNCDTCLIVNRTRTRELIVPPSNGGKSCPSFTEMIPCANCTETYTYKIGPWGVCTPFENHMQIHGKIHPLLGHQKRTVGCLTSKGITVGLTICVQVLRSKDTELIDKQTCIIPQDCQVGRYSDGTRLPGYMIKTRHIEQIPQGIGKPCPPLVHIIPVKSTDEQPRYEWKMSSWSQCTTPTGGYPCTTGLQIRKAICTQRDGGREKPTDDHYCTEKHLVTAQMCQAKCDIDCVLSQWTEWSECKVTDCELYIRRRRNNEGTGQRHRTRKVLTNSRGQGRQCLHLSETQMCDPQPCYQWNITVGQCRLLHSNMSPECGLGIAYRTLSCLNKLGGKKSKKKKNKSRPVWRFHPYIGFDDDDDDRGDTEQLRVADVKCEELKERPAEKEDCNIPCPNDCILSPWSPWSPCPNLCQEGKSTPATQKRERTILALPGQGGASCPPNRDLLQMQVCPTTIECTIYVWQTDPWDMCRINDPSNSCGPGRQSRVVNCYSLAGQLVSDQRCTLEVKPKDYQSCTVPCPIDCQVTDYSDWSPCSSSCWEAKQTIPVMTRVRYVIQEPRNGGNPCPIKLQEVRQCTNLTLCQKFYWDTSSWSRCILPLHKIPQCGKGLQARDITCKAENGTSQDLDVCIRKIGPMPSVSRVCYQSCDEECMFEEWSEWSKCINGCDGNRFRTRKLIEVGSVSTQCKDHRLYPVDSFEKCLCDVHRAVPIGNWSECILESDNEFYKTFRTFQGYTLEGDKIDREPTTSFRPSASVGVNAVCGQGKRYKVLACQNDKGEMEAANKCTLKPYEEERCLIACPVDCIMSDWSFWTDCSTSCGTGTQSRYREIKQIPSDGGRECPSLDDKGKDIQTRVCTTKCRQFIWESLKWSPCMPYRIYESCGNGTQSRNVRCMKVIGDGYEPEDADDDKCTHMIKPPDTQTCVAPCVGECVVSDWMEWSRCKQPCSNPNQVQTRTRLILRHPSADPNNMCPSTLEERFCIRGQNCLEYRWQMSDWTTCLINGGKDECGIGHKHRFPICYDQHNNVIDPETCKEVIGESKDKKIMSCSVWCDVDCLLTEWSPWSSCSSTCGLGNQQRKREIVQGHKGNGRPCPNLHMQEKPCFLRGCYTWNVSPWSPCIDQKRICGYGIQTRNISCMADGGLAVNESNCEADLNIVVLERERFCRVPCPGECVMSDWSEWNDCFLDCKDYSRKDFTRGIQSRSRAVLANAMPDQTPCPEQLWDSRPCDVSKCYTFGWKTSGWSQEKTQSIWCERSDGLFVVGGCSDHSKPPSNLSCNPPCSVPYTVCNNTNVCVCEPKYKPFYNRLGVLISCKRMDNSTVTNPSKSVTLPADGPTNVWMYAVIAAGTLFVIFLAVACYTMSEFFHKGPRPRKKDEEKSIEGAENVDGMVAETAFASCNHLAPVAAISELDSQSMISADRTPPQSVRAHACNGNAGMNFQKTAPLTKPDCEPMTRVPDAPDYVGQHYSVLLHDSKDTSKGDHVWKLHGNRHLDKCSLNVHDNLEIDTDNFERHMHEVPLDRRETQTHKIPNIHDKARTCPVPTNLCAEVDRQGNVKSSATKVSDEDRKRGSLESKTSNRFSKLKAKYIKDKHTRDTNNLNDEDTLCVPHSCAYRNMDATKYLHLPSRGSGEFAVNPEDIVYLNREASDAEEEEVKTGNNERNSFSLNTFLQSVLEKIDNITSEGNSPSDNNEHGQMFEANEDVEMESVSEVECEPLLERTSNLNHNDATARSYIKTGSIAQPLSYMDIQNRGKQTLYSDDDNVSRTHSLRSQVSSRSRTSHLSFSMGPVIKIDPDETKMFDFNRNSLPKTLYSSSYPTPPVRPQHATLPKQHLNVGYISLSSIDTELSTAPSSSVSCDSLSPRSLPSESLSDASAVDNTRVRGLETNSEKSTSRNVALGSLKNAYNAKQLKNLDHELYKDSGVGSIGLNGDNISNKTGSTTISIKSNKTGERTPEEGIVDHRDKPQNNRMDSSKRNGFENSDQNCFHGESSNLLTPLYFLNLKSKRETLVKQTCSDDLDCSEV